MPNARQVQGTTRLQQAHRDPGETGGDMIWILKYIAWPIFCGAFSSILITTFYRRQIRSLRGKLSLANLTISELQKDGWAAIEGKPTPYEKAAAALDHMVIPRAKKRPKCIETMPDCEAWGWDRCIDGRCSYHCKHKCNCTMTS